jgi:hypothetical protein
MTQRKRREKYRLAEKSSKGMKPMCGEMVRHRPNWISIFTPRQMRRRFETVLLRFFCNGEEESTR